MKAVIIRDMVPDKKFLAVDLRDVLNVLGPRALRSNWCVRNVWATGDAAPELERLREDQLVSGTALRGMAEDVVQVIDGVFTGFELDCSAPWVVIEAADSSYYEVYSPEPSVLEVMRRSFRDVSDDDDYSL